MFSRGFVGALTFRLLPSGARCTLDAHPKPANGGVLAALRGAFMRGLEVAHVETLGRVVRPPRAAGGRSG